MKNPPSINRLSALTVRQAQSQNAIMQHELRALRDSMSGLAHAIKAPKIGIKRTKTKKTTTPSVLNEIFSGANLLSGSALGSSLGVSTSFYSSSAQQAAQNLATLNLAQRNN